MKKVYLYFVWIVSLVSLLGSLYFSQVLKYTPCNLCWVQRIFMFPLVLILLAGILLKDKNVFWYSLPLSVIGFGFAIYHNLVYYGVVSESAVCEINVPCTQKQFELFGFLGIPALSAISFFLIIVGLLIYKTRKD